MTTPTRQQIIQESVRLDAQHQAITNEDYVTPENYELKEDGFTEEARSNLMSNHYQSQVEYLKLSAEELKGKFLTKEELEKGKVPDRPPEFIFRDRTVEKVVYVEQPIPPPPQDKPRYIIPKQKLREKLLCAAWFRFVNKERAKAWRKAKV